MHKSVKSVFDDECKHLTIDSRFVKKLHDYQFRFVHRSSEHAEFFGGNLTGVHVVRFTDADKDAWFDEILEANDTILNDLLIKLPDINQDFFVSSDTMNLSCVWLTHAIYNSNKLNDTQRHQAMIDVMLVLQYKFLTSRLFKYFRFPADKSIAEAVYASMSFKYAIKKYGSWSAVLLARSEDIIGKESIHYRAIVRMDSDEDVVRMLNDVQGRIRDMFKNIYALHMEIANSSNRIHTISATMEHDGAEILKDQKKVLPEYIRYINSIISDKASFYREELVAVIEKMMHTMPPRLFRETLEYMSANYRLSGAAEIEEVLSEILLHTFDYLHQNRSLVKNTHDLPGILSKLRGVLMSSRSTDEGLLALREKIETVVRKATGNKNQSVLASVRTGIYLYIVLRTITKKHYS